MREISVGYVGPFCDNNFGDYGMLVNDIYDIDVSDIVIFSYNAVFINNIVEKYLSHLNTVKVCQIDFCQNRDVQTGKYYNVEYDDYDETPLEIMTEVKNIEEVDKAVKSVNMLIVTGGGWINEVWYAKHRIERLKSIILPIILAARYDIPIVYMGNTFGPLKKSTNFFSNFFAYTYKNSKFACRDDFSSILEMRRLGITDVNSVPDDFYFLNSSLKEQKVNERVKRYIEKGKYIIIENYISLGELEKNISKLKEFVAKMRKNYKVRVLFLPMGECYGGAYQAELIKRNVPEIDIWEIDEGIALDIVDIEEIIKNAQFVICQRYHLLIRAVANNVPVKQILKDVCGDKNYYYVKTMGALTKLFKGSPNEEQLWFGLEYWEELYKVQEQYLAIIEQWKNLYDDRKKENEKSQLQVREKYIEEHIWKLLYNIQM